MGTFTNWNGGQVNKAGAQQLLLLYYYYFTCISPYSQGLKVANQVNRGCDSSVKAQTRKVQGLACTSKAFALFMVGWKFTWRGHIKEEAVLECTSPTQ